MKRIMVLVFISVVFAVPSLGFAMNITPYDNAQNLAQNLVGSGITISNVTYTGATAASGYFSGGNAAGIGIDTGIVLTSGFASNLQGTSNTSSEITGNNGLVGASFLNALVPGYYTYDATYLEFDFVSIGDAAYFAYTFGSDEYNEYVGSEFNDVFGFFVGEKVPGNNVALIPGTTTPVSVNSVNNGSNSTFYNDNTGGAFAFEYDGFTDVLTASILGLTAGTTYHLTLAIADSGDYILDAGVFLGAGTFSDKPPSVPEPATMLLLASGLVGLAGARRFRK